MDYPIKPVRGNWFKLAQPLEKIVWLNSQHTIEDYVPAEGDNFKVTLVGAYDHYEMEKVKVELNPDNNKRNLLTYENNGTLPLGLYDIEISVTLADGRRLHSCQPKRVKVVKTNREASIPDYVEFGVDTYELDGAVFMYVPSEGGSGDMSNYYTKDEADARYLQDESDPTVPAWAKQPTKPTYMAQEVGALPANTPIPSASDTTPSMDGVGSAGSATTFARADHQHPSDTTKQDVINDLADIRSGASKGATAYQKPSTGIPKTDLASDVQTSLGNADSALQSQEQADWNENDSTKPSFIKNKPTIPSAQIQADWNQSDNTKADYIKNKPTIDIAGKEDKVAIITPELDNNNAFNASVGNYYKVTGNASAIDITLVTPSDTSHLTNCIFLIDNSNGVGASFHTQNLPFYQSANFAIATGKVYEVNALFNGTAWYLTQVEMEVQS